MRVIFICFGALTYVSMARPKKTEPKRVRLSVTLHPTILEWAQQQVGSTMDNKPFRSISDLIDKAILTLKERMEKDK